MKNCDVVVSGGLGFIGSSIVNSCIDDNKVTIIDDSSSGTIKNINNPNHKNLDIIEANLNDLDLNNVLKGKDYIFHLAAMSNVAWSIDEPERCMNNNVSSTEKLINASIEAGIKKIIFSSSSSIYGDNLNLPLKETEVPMPQSPYAQSKLQCEKLLNDAYIKNGLKHVSLRYFNVFGPKQNIYSDYAAVIPKFISSLLKGDQPIIYGDGEQTRDFVYIKDIVDMNFLACEADLNGVLNIASGNKISINTLFNIIKKLLDSDINPTYLPPREGEIKHSLADITKMKENNFVLKYTNFEDNLIETINYFKQII